ncbi:MAG: hypothetical protein D6677_09060 [Calditrichaeota bacterium]|nr:MAG: hypothetical protein D6677_09060 [Calditrichota bacterium]
MRNIIFILMATVSVLWAQKIDISGRISLNALNTQYDETSQIKPDSVSDETYGKTTLIPGLSQNLNLALFARTSTLDISLLGDIRNNRWNVLSLSNQNTIDRLSLAVRFGNHEITLGDFYVSGSDLFMQSREMRGGRAVFKFNRIWSSRSFMEVSVLGGLAQKKLAIGDRAVGLYKQFETSGVYRRFLAGGDFRLGESGNFDVGLHYLFARDDSSSIKADANSDDALNAPLQNHNAGLDFNWLLWKKRLKLFGEGFFSKKDTISAGDARDYSLRGGFDLRYESFKLVAFYQRLGYNFYSAGYPFLLNDRNGFKIETAYRFPKYVVLAMDGEQYANNLIKDENIPTTRTRLANLNVTTFIRKGPEVTLGVGYRDDISNSVFDADNNETKTNKVSKKMEGRVSQDIGFNRYSLSAIYLDLDDKSKITGSDPLGTAQLIGSFNIYTRPTNNFFISGGLVYSRLKLTDGKDNVNYYLYESHRWDIIPLKLVFESNITATKNDAEGGGNEDLLSNYWQIAGQMSFEYFFVPGFSAKLIAGINQRQMSYTVDEALKILEEPDTDPTFFNGNESYNALIYGLEFNWMF